MRDGRKGDSMRTMRRAQMPARTGRRRMVRLQAGMRKSAGQRTGSSAESAERNGNNKNVFRVPGDAGASMLNALVLSAVGVGMSVGPGPSSAADYIPSGEGATTSADRRGGVVEMQRQGSGGGLSFPGGMSQGAPDVGTSSSPGLPEGNNWRYSEFIKAVEAGQVERVRFAKDGSALQLTASDGRRATVVLPNDPELVDILAKNGVDITVSEGAQQNNVVGLLGNLLFPLLAFAGLFLLFRRAQGHKPKTAGRKAAGSPATS